MLKNYLKITLRNMIRYKGYSFITIFGLAIGITCCMLIFLWIQDELGYDRFHTDNLNIYQVLSHTDIKNIAVTPVLLGPTLKDKYPEIVETTRYHWFFSGTTFKYEDKQFIEKGVRLADPSFFTVFSFPFLKGNPETALEDPYSIVISETIAKKYFAEKDPIGHILTMNNQHDFTVTGVVKNVPNNSTLRFDMVIPMQFRIQTEKTWYTNWDNLFVFTFIKLHDHCTADNINAKIAHIAEEKTKGKRVTLSVLPFNERHFFFYSDKMYVYIFATIAIFILMIAGFNYMNLATARSVKRAKEIGMRKVNGASRKHIIVQFLGESLFISLAALVLSLTFLSLLLPLFNTLTEKEMVLNYTFILPVSIGLTLVTGIVAGSYPAFFLSSFQLSKILGGNLKSGAKGSVLRKILVVSQFMISIVLIMGMMVVHKQLHYFRNKNPGYEREHMVSIPMSGGSEKYYQRFKTELLRDAKIRGVSGTAAALPHVHWQIDAFHWEGKDPGKKISINYNAIDFDFVETLKIKLLKGRSFSRKLDSEASNPFLINQEMEKLMGMKSAVGTTLRYGEESGKIMGVMENFHFLPYSQHIEPLIIHLKPKSVDNLLIRIPPDNISESLGFIKQTWEKIIPLHPFQYSFLDESFERSFSDVEKTGHLLNSFAVLAVIISCLGLLGLVSFSAEERTKEIGIRKILGASVSGIVLLLNKELSRCIAIATLIAWPFGYFAMNHWLMNFAYRTRIGIFIFILSSALAFIIALITVSYQTLRAANFNPVDSLRYE